MRGPVRGSLAHTFRGCHGRLLNVGVPGGELEDEDDDLGLPAVPTAAPTKATAKAAPAAPAAADPFADLEALAAL